MALCECCGQSLPETYIKGDLIIRTNPLELLWKGALVRSTPTRVRLLKLLVQLGRVSTPAAMVIMPGLDSSPEVLRVHLVNLRRDLAAADVPIVISSLRGWGYQLTWMDEP